MKSGFVRRREPPRRNINFFSFSQAHPPLPPLSTSLFLSLPPFLLGLATFLRHHPLSLPSFHEAPPRLSTDRKVFQPEETFQLCLSPSLEIVAEASENLAPSGYPANTGSFFRGGYYVSLPRILDKTCEFHKTRHRSTTYESAPEFRIRQLFTSATTAWITNSSHSGKFYEKGRGDKHR